MNLAAFDSEAIGQLVILLLLGAGSLVKKFFEAKQVVDDAKGPDAFERANERKRTEIFDRLADLEEEMEQELQDPWGPGGGEEVRAKSTESLGVEELVGEPTFVAESYDPAAATREVSIESASLEGVSLEGASFDQGTASTEPWEPGGRIRASVFEDIEQSVSKDITEHVAADMAGGVRGEATAVKATVHKLSRAHRGWRDAVIAAEILGAPVSLRGPATQPLGLRSE